MEFSLLTSGLATTGGVISAATWATFAAFCLVAYLLGSISTAIIVCRLGAYPDPRSEGSGNPGATNVLRVAGKPAAAVTLFGDVLKGVVPLLLARMAGIEGAALAWVGFFAFLGHLYPVFFGFDGGKGVATALGVINTLAWPAGVAVMLSWLLVFLPFRVSSLAAIASWLLAPLYTAWLAPAYVVPVSLMAVLLLWRHQQNIRDLLGGRERSFRKPGGD